MNAAISLPLSLVALRGSSQDQKQGQEPYSHASCLELLQFHSSRRRRPKHSRGEHEGEQRKQENYDETEYGPNRSKPVANWPFLLGNPFAPTTPHRLSYEHRAKPDLPISAEANASRQRKKYSSQNKAVIARATDNPAEADRHNSDRNKRQQENTRR